MNSRFNNRWACRHYARCVRRLIPCGYPRVWTGNPSRQAGAANNDSGAAAIFSLRQQGPSIPWLNVHAFGEGTFKPLLSSRGKPELNSILDFGQGHRDGRNLVEADIPYGAVKSDSINAYLGAQGNQTLSAVFHEASPNVLFFLPTTNAFSGFPDNFGISSVLADDLDFAEQSLGRHVRRAQFLGVHYLVIHHLKLLLGKTRFHRS